MYQNQTDGISEDKNITTNPERNNCRKNSNKSRGTHFRNANGGLNKGTPNFYQSTIAKEVIAVLDGITFSLCVSVVTMYVLVADDVRQWAFPPSADLGFTIANIFCMTIFSVEMLLLSIFKEGYVFKFYFWLDLISLVTMVFDLMWINDMLSLGNYNKAASVVKMVRAGRASKIGSRSARLIRIIRLIRILRLYKTASARISKNENKKQTVTLNNDEKSYRMKPAMGESVRKEREAIYRENSYPGPNNSKDIFHTIGTEDPVNKQSEQEVAEEEETVISPIRMFTSKPNSLKVRDSLADKSTFRHFINNSSAEVVACSPRQVFSIASNHEPQMIESTILKNQTNTIRQDPATEDDDEGQRSPSPSSQKKQTKVVINEPTVIQNRKSSVEESSSTIEVEVPTETNVGLKLKDEIQKNIILMVILILISVPMFSTTVWIDVESAETRSVLYFKYFTYNTAYSSTSLQVQIRDFILFGINMTSPLVYLYFPVNASCCEFPTNFPEYSSNDIGNIRGSSLTIANYENVTAIFDDTPIDILTAQLSIGRTFFICILLIVSSLLFAKDVEEHALEPLENMYDTVKKITKDPLKAIIQIQNEALLKNELEVREEVKTEPIILENMIIKIGSLLVVGFGEAGSEMISKNIESYKALNAGLQGRKVMAIFGFCDIRNFTDATEVLQTKVMNFVNDIASIVHGTVNRYAGSANKNIGDAFLVAWKFGEQETLSYEKNGQTHVSLKKISKVRQIADLAVFSFVKIIAECNKSHTLLKYKNNEKLQARIKNYKGVTMGFGLHVGWAIEGGIGSKFKIDASYLSPNVNMASRLEAATKQYGTYILITGDLAELMTPANKTELRKIDRVKFSGQQQPYDIYTIDLNVANLVAHVTIKPKSSHLSDYERKKQKIAVNRVRQNLLQKLETSKKLTENLFSSDKDYVLMKGPYTSNFYKAWEEAYSHFEKGDWKTALPLLQKTQVTHLYSKKSNNLNFNNQQVMLQKIIDGPSKNLINVIKRHDSTAPTGYREFIEK